MSIELKRMTPSRAAYFMERFKREEKLLGPNEQAALTYVIDMLEKATAIQQAEAQQPATPKTVYWEWRHLSTHPDTVDFGKWSEWKRVEARSAIHTIEDALAEFRAYIAQGYKYELRALYTHPAPSVPDDDFDLICNAIDKADTITMEGGYMLDSDDCIAVVRVMQVLLSVRAAMLAAK